MWWRGATTFQNPHFLFLMLDSGPMSLKLPVVRDHHIVYIPGHVFVSTFLCNCDINELTVRCALEQQTFKRRCLCNPMPRQHRQPADLPWQCKVSSCSTKNSCLTFPWQNYNVKFLLTPFPCKGITWLSPLVKLQFKVSSLTLSFWRTHLALAFQARVRSSCLCNLKSLVMHVLAKTQILSATSPCL